MFQALSEWRVEDSATEIVLVRGNHDRQAGDPPSSLSIECVNAPWPAPPFILAHHPVAHPDGYVIAGHVHPGVRLYGAGGQRERLACFVFGPDYGVLPAFGDFTGLADLDPDPEHAVYAIAEDRVISR